MFLLQPCLVQMSLPVRVHPSLQHVRPIIVNPDHLQLQDNAFMDMFVLRTQLGTVSVHYIHFMFDVIYT